MLARSGLYAGNVIKDTFYRKMSAKVGDGVFVYMYNAAATGHRSRICYSIMSMLHVSNKMIQLRDGHVNLSRSSWQSLHTPSSPPPL